MNALKCSVCNGELHRVGLERMENGKIVAEFECNSCHNRFVLPFPSKPRLG